MRFVPFFPVILLAVPGMVSGGEKKADALPGVKVHLELVPVSGEARVVLRCTVKNATDKNIEVPLHYDGKVVRLNGQGKGQRWEMSLFPPKNPIKGAWTQLKPGEDVRPFEFSSRQLWFDSLQPPFKPTELGWRWDWKARPGPPPTPFHDSQRTGNLLPEATFWVTLDVQGQQVQSNKLRLKLRLSVEVEEGK